MTFAKAFLKALAAAAAAAGVIIGQHLIAFFQGAAPSDVSTMLWAGISFVAVLALNYLIGKIPTTNA